MKTACYSTIVFVLMYLMLLTSIVLKVSGQFPPPFYPPPSNGNGLGLLLLGLLLLGAFFLPSLQTSVSGPKVNVTNEEAVANGANSNSKTNSSSNSFAKAAAGP